MYWPGQTGAAEISRWALIAIACPALLLLVKIRITTVHRWGIALLIWATASLAWSTVFYDALNAWLQLAFMACAFAIAAETADLKWFYRGLGAGMLVSFAVVIMQLGGMNVAMVAPGNAAPTGLFVNSNVLGWTAAVVFVLLIAQHSRTEYLLAVPAAFCLMMSDCRSAIGVAAACFLAIIWQRNRWAGTAFGLIIGAEIAHRYHRIADMSSMQQRLGIWHDTLTGVTPFGHGIGSFYSAFSAYSTGLTSEGFWLDLSHAHNDALEILFELGVPGLAICGIIIALAWRYGAPAERYGLACIGGTSLVGFPLHQPLTAVLFAVLAGHAARGWHLLRSPQLHRGPRFHARQYDPDHGAFVAGLTLVPAGSSLPAGAAAPDHPR
jgi:hypothetical protein